MSWYSIVRRGGTTSTPWDPSQLSSTSIWVDIDSLGLSNGSGITTMTDQTGNGYDLTGSSTHATVVSGDLNGLDVAEFQGVGGYTLSTWPGPFGNDGFMFAGVLELITGVGSYLSDLRFGNQQLASFTYYDSNELLQAANQRRLSTDTGVFVTASVSSTTGWAVVVLAHDYTSGAITSRVNGSTVATGTLASTGSGPHNSVSLALGSRTTNASPYQKKMAEALWFDDRLTTGATGDLERVEGYLAHRYNLQSKLLAGHPYKTTAPTA